MTKRILIFGAGKIGRGFIGHLFHRSGYALTFVDPSQEVIAQLKHDCQYPLYIMGRSGAPDIVPVDAAISLDDSAAIECAVADHDLFATAVGGANLDTVGTLLGKGVAKRLQAGSTGNVNVIVCENYKNPAAILRKACYAAGDEKLTRWGEAYLGIAETQVLRSCIEPTPAMRQENPLAIQVQDWWTLPCDADAFRGPAPACEGLKLKHNFQNELIRKVYTYNCSNATIAYLGFLKGYTMLSQAALDPEILEITQKVYDESGAGLSAEYGFDATEQRDLQNLAITKYQDTSIVDPIERNGRDSRRKLSPTDRLLGPANLCLKHGGTPRHLAMALAAGLHYSGSDDPGTQHVQKVLHDRGLKAAIADVCQLESDSPLTTLIVDGARRLSSFNKIGIRVFTE